MSEESAGVGTMEWALSVDGKKTAVKGSPKTVGALLASLSLSREEALVRVDGKIRPEGASLSGAGKIEVIRVVYGG